jgi:hypothetical protein
VFEFLHAHQDDSPVFKALWGLVCAGASGRPVASVWPAIAVLEPYVLDPDFFRYRGDAGDLNQSIELLVGQ